MRGRSSPKIAAAGGHSRQHGFEGEQAGLDEVREEGRERRLEAGDADGAASNGTSFSSVA